MFGIPLFENLWSGEENIQTGLLAVRMLIKARVWFPELICFPENSGKKYEKNDGKQNALKAE